MSRMSKLRIRIISESPKDINNVVNQLYELAKVLGMKFKGPVPLPRRRLEIPLRRSPCGDGTETYEHWEKRISKRLVDILGDEKYIKQILKIKVPTTVFVKISLS